MDITPEIQELLDEKLADALKDIKEKLNEAYSARDIALDRLKKAEAEHKTFLRDHDLELLKAREEGRASGEKTLADTLKRVEALETHNKSLAKANVISTVLTGYSFRNAAAAKIASDMLADKLQQNAEGVWVLPDGKAPADHVKEMLASEEYSFLLKPAVSSGGGTKPGTGAGEHEKSLLDSSNEEILKRYMK